MGCFVRWNSKGFEICPAGIVQKDNDDIGRAGVACKKREDKEENGE